MFISKKKFEQLDKRIADLERQVQSQQKEITVKLDIPNSNANDLIIENIQKWQVEGCVRCFNGYVC